MTGRHAGRLHAGWRASSSLRQGSAVVRIKPIGRVEKGAIARIQPEPKPDRGALDYRPTGSGQTEAGGQGPATNLEILQAQLERAWSEIKLTIKRTCISSKSQLTGN